MVEIISCTLYISPRPPKFLLGLNSIRGSEFFTRTFILLGHSVPTVSAAEFELQLSPLFTETLGCSAVLAGHSKGWQQKQQNV